MPDKGDVIALPVDGQQITARVSVRSEIQEMVKEMDYEARELSCTIGVARFFAAISAGERGYRQPC